MINPLKFAPIVLIILTLFSCMDKPKSTTPDKNTEKTASLNKNPKGLLFSEIPRIKKTYQNELFWDVTVEKSETAKYSVKGKVKNSLSSFNYVVEDGHYQLLKDVVTVNKLTPEWGIFNLTFEAIKKDKNTTLILALFEKSTKANNKNLILDIPLN